MIDKTITACAFGLVHAFSTHHGVHFGAHYLGDTPTELFAHSDNRAAVRQLARDLRALGLEAVSLEGGFSEREVWLRAKLA